MNKFRLGAVMALLVIVVCAISGCGTSTVSVADVTYKDMPLQIHNEANVTALNKATITPAVSGAATYAVKVGDKVKVKVLNTNDSRISLSIKAAEENAQAEEIEDTDAKQYSSGESLGTSLGDLFAKLKL